MTKDVNFDPVVETLGGLLPLINANKTKKFRESYFSQDVFYDYATHFFENDITEHLYQSDELALSIPRDDADYMKGVVYNDYSNDEQRMHHIRLKTSFSLSENEADEARQFYCNNPEFLIAMNVIYKCVRGYVEDLTDAFCEKHGSLDETLLLAEISDMHFHLAHNLAIMRSNSRIPSTIIDLAPSIASSLQNQGGKINDESMQIALRDVFKRSVMRSSIKKLALDKKFPFVKRDFDVSVCPIAPSLNMIMSLNLDHSAENGLVANRGRFGDFILSAIDKVRRDLGAEKINEYSSAFDAQVS